MAADNDLLSRTRAAVWHPCTQMKQLEAAPPLPIARGEGVWLVDTDGRRYLDAISSWWVNLFGHCNPRINAAIVDQLGRIEHVMLAGATHEPVVALSERLAKLTGLGHAFYGSDGASATEIALKMSAHFWRNAGQTEKNGFISLQNGYHGETVGALSVTDIPLFKATYASLLRHTVQVPTPDARLAETGETAEEFALRCADALEAHLVEHAAETAAFIVEPLVQGATGMAMYHPVYLKRARELCTKYRVHLIADEIAVGFGRTGTMFACEQAAIHPDFICLSKGITGGYLPLSAVLTTDAVYAAFYGDATARGFLHSHSYTGNPLACRAALAVLDIFETDQVIAANRIKAQEFTGLLADVAMHPRVRHFRQRGMIWAFDVADAQPGFSARLHQAALGQGVFIRPIGNTVYVMPPYVTSADDIRMLGAVLLACLKNPDI
ncbi:MULTISPECIES: adenosylmethionine--8-amino-7-oxononanoate transaminase [unclassified Thiobacillus]|uniref:adenosylmethionine--8-amino-7-oxononanoate transaminase n=1 Tax=unclassified Thiobacillus TaxID=2646513 RepID=UPI00086EC597|nr:MULTISPECIES: adenosylmethionine--8-amino-7-oxononanoate transaminase [unclassified Thiobacillus]MBN8779232.1 adenosylmethionine--8-amino-7-oxononanoate transaminase [Thiobacillus sp.]ODU99903.1 MAG: adenosylmethionine--8-amino-7-oxononanoate transaminase [Thiobacillus sp. SCN 63-57]